MKVSAFDVPPPAFRTVTGNVPGTSRSLAVMAAVNSVELTYVAVLLLPLNRTVDLPLTNSVPFTVSVKPGSPALFEAGLRLDAVGVAVLPMRLLVSEAVHRERSLIPPTVIVRKAVLTMPPWLFQVVPLSRDR